ncbi:hypothetical protein F5X71_17345 [Nocardia brasiliensis]|uniref:4Fe-4S Wbl-type domain-containing protein n=1 Tax=Nocardia brasiliensis TaxID=37326 RepID=A0A6G9XSI0_NOCBR|nr:hypothetical protein F5X71_17345 [Nocardia brasiliensis]
MNWRQRAACRAVAPGIFYPAAPPKGDPRQALAYCRRCPVLARCAGHALAIAQRRGIVAGVWIDGDRDAHVTLREIGRGHARPRRCVKCWRLIESARAERSCALCGFAEIPV